MRSLLVANDVLLKGKVLKVLANSGFDVAHTSSGADGVDIMKRYDYDIAVVCLELGDITGLQVLRQARIAKVRTPLVMLALESKVAMKLAAFESGADDYLVRPFDAAELVARMRAIARRSQGHVESTLSVGPVTLNITLREVCVKGLDLPVTNTEYTILELLMLRNKSIVTKGHIIEHLYHGKDEPDSKSIDVILSKLRKKLSAAGAPNFIRTVWGAGLTVRDSQRQALSPPNDALRIAS